MRPPGWRVLRGVVEQVREHLREARRVAVDVTRARAAGRTSQLRGRCASISGVTVSTALRITARQLEALRLRARACRW